MPRLKSLRSTLLLITRINPIHKYVTEVDRKVLRKRIDGEGITFCCKLLPSLGTALERGLKLGAMSAVPGFKTPAGKKVPLFLYEAWCGVFDPETGLLRERPIEDAILCIRQLTKAVHKSEFGGNTTLEKECWGRFVENQNRLANSDIKSVIGNSRDQLLTFKRKRIPLEAILYGARKIVLQFAAGFDASSTIPKHGNGACPARIIPVLRYDPNTMAYNRRVDRVFPYEQFLFYNEGHYARHLGLVRSLVRKNIFYDKASFVPKDYTKVRGISLVPHTLMYFQQALASWMKEKMRSQPYRNKIDITDQSRNQRWARQGSIDGYTSTLDLSDASDSLSNDLVKYLFGGTALGEALQAVRSKGTEYEGMRIKYSCYAPQGAATCFPTQTLVFYALVQATSRSALGREALVSTYGDDIICETSVSDLVIEVLTRLGLKINIDKSFTSGFFRESCGADYYRGNLVTPVKLTDDISPVVPGASNDHRHRTAIKVCDFFNRLIRRYEIHDEEYPHIVMRKMLRAVYGVNPPIIPYEHFPQSDNCQWERDVPNHEALISLSNVWNLNGAESRLNKKTGAREFRVRTAKPNITPVYTDLDRMEIPFSRLHEIRGGIKASSGWSELLRYELLHRRSRSEWNRGYVVRDDDKLTRTWLSKDSGGLNTALGEKLLAVCFDRPLDYRRD